MTEPQWVSLRAVEAIHERQLSIDGGLSGIRDMGMLESALMRPQNLWACAPSPPSIERLAASYAFGISSNHPFIDGNKRTAFLTAYVFLAKNGLTLFAEETDVVKTFLALAANQLPEKELEGWLQRSVKINA